MGIVAAVSTFFLLLLSMTLLKRHLLEEQESDSDSDDDRQDELRSDNFNVGAIAAFVLMAQIGRRFRREPTSSSIRIAFVSISFGGFVIISLYRAMLGASLAVRIHHPPFRSVEELLRISTPVMIENGTSIYRYFAEADPDSLPRILFEEKIRRNGGITHLTETQGFELIANRKEDRIISPPQHKACFSITFIFSRTCIDICYK